MAFLAKFERNFLFGLTRAFAMFFIITTLTGLLIGGLVVLNQAGNQSNQVEPQEVINVLKPSLAVENAEPTTLQAPSIPQPKRLPAGLKLPFILQKHFSDPNHMETLIDWLSAVPHEQQQTF